MVTTVELAGARVPAWRGGFGRLWSAAVLSSFGDALRTAALPLLATTLTDKPLLIASVTACGYLPWLVFGLLGGAVADRVDQRRAMWTVDAVRGLLVACFAVAVGLGHASIGLLIALAFALTTLQTLFDNASTALLPTLVDKEALGAANARLMTGQRIAGGLLAGPLVPVLHRAGRGRSLRRRCCHLPGRGGPGRLAAAGGVRGGHRDRRAAPCARRSRPACAPCGTTGRCVACARPRHCATWAWAP